MVHAAHPATRCALQLRGRGHDFPAAGAPVHQDGLNPLPRPTVTGMLLGTRPDPHHAGMGPGGARPAPASLAAPHLCGLATPPQLAKVPGPPALLCGYAIPRSPSDHQDPVMAPLHHPLWGASGTKLRRDLGRHRRWSHRCLPPKRRLRPGHNHPAGRRRHGRRG